MKHLFNVFFVIILVLAINTKINAQSMNDNSRGKVDIIEQSIKEIEKAKSKNIKVRNRYAAFYNVYGKLPKTKTLVEKVTFDKKGLRKEQIRYNSLGKIERRYTFTFDNKNSLTKMYVYNSQKVLIGKRESTYDKKGNEIERVLLDKENGGPAKMLFAYDTDNRITETKNYNDKNELLNIYKNEYKNGKLSHSAIVDKDGKVIVETNFSYDSNGKLIREDVRESSSYSINYKYDLNGNLLEITNPQTKRIMNYNKNNDLIEDKLIRADGKRQYRITFSYLKNGLQDEEIRFDNTESPVFNGKYEYEYYK